MAELHKQLNLLPEDRRALLARLRLNLKLLRLALLTATLAIAGLVTLRAWEQTVTEGVRLAETRAAGLAANLAPFAALRTDATLIDDRLQTIDAILAKRLSWTALSLALAESTPPDVQIVALTPAKKSGVLMFSLAGKATSRTSLIRFKETLEATEFFEAILLESLQATVAADGGELLDFSLTGLLTGKSSSAPLPAPSQADEDAL